MSELKQVPQILDIPKVYYPVLEGLNDYRYFLCEGGRNSLKCFHPDTPMLLYDGSLTFMRDIRVGDVLRSPDNKPRVVLEKHSGYGKLFKINQTKGDSYIVNQDHLLSLKKRASCRAEKRKGKSGAYIKSRSRYTSFADTIALPVEEFNGKSTRFRENFRGWKGDLINYPKREVTIDPYFLGLWLGDGDKNIPIITNIDPEIIVTSKNMAIS